MAEDDNNKNSNTSPNRWRRVGFDLLFLLGMISTTFGISQIYEPAAFIFAGSVAIVIALAVARGL